MRDESTLSGCSGEGASDSGEGTEEGGQMQGASWGLHVPPCASMWLEDRSQMIKGPLFHMYEFELDNA